MYNTMPPYQGGSGQPAQNYQQSSPNPTYGPLPAMQPRAAPMQRPAAQNNPSYQTLGPTPQPPVRSWGKLITEQKTASPALIAYITSLYNYLDQGVAPFNQGGLSPEKIGLLGEIQGYYGDAGLYGQMKTAGSHSGQGAAFVDAQFTTVYNSYALSYTTTLRPATPNPPAATAAAVFLSSFLTPQPSSMPLLTLNGLLTWMVLNILRQPHQEWICMQKSLSSVQLIQMARLFQEQLIEDVFRRERILMQ